FADIELGGHGREGRLVAGTAGFEPDLSRIVGWFTTLFPVTVDTGPADDATDPADLARYARLLQPWPRLPGQVMDSAVRITPHLVSGVRLVAAG
ncbi:hypothetical protein, partial [Pseudomonas sp. SID14000]|uniref:hypothetical protein n=1 Tax=Pseudomonas sp. SID14000 TaxID=1986221 RepID=UPI001C43A528